MNRFFGPGQGLTNQPGGLDVGIPAGGGGIKSIQRGFSAVAAGSSTANIGISAVDLTKSVIFINPGVTNGANISDWVLGAQLTSATNIQVLRNGTAGNSNVNWQVVEFSNVKSKQSGILSITGSTAVTQTISSVDTSKSLLICSWTSNDTTTTMGRAFVECTLTNSTTITFTAVTATSKNMYWQVIEFN